MPKLSDTMEEGTIGEWKKKSGEQVKAGEVLAEVESDKATFDLEAETDGVLQILVEQGVPAKIGAPIAKIGEGAAEAPAKETPPKDAPTKKAPAAEARPQEPETPPAGRAQGADSGRTAEKREPAQKSAPPKEEAPPERKPEPARADERSDGQADGQKGDDRGIKASPLARRLAGEMGVDLASIKGTGPEGRIVKEDVLAAGTARPTADRRRPPAVSDRRASAEMEMVEPNRMQATIARPGRPAERHLSGATFSVSNLGMFGVDEFTAIINPLEAAILAVGAIKDVSVVDGGRIVPGKVMRTTLSVDHRVFYGATAAQFMAEIKRLIENPVTLLVPQG